jgi:starch phosphorylase
LVAERDGRKLRMGHLAFIGSHCTNGVSALHTSLMRKTVFRELHAMYPDRIVNKTNGVTFKRWLLHTNPNLTRNLREVCGDAVLDDPTQMLQLADHAQTAGFRKRIRAAKRANKVALARLIVERLNVSVETPGLAAVCEKVANSIEDRLIGGQIFSTKTDRRHDMRRAL